MAANRKKASAARSGGSAVHRSFSKLRPVSFADVRIDGGLWGERMRVNREVTLPVEYDQCKSTGRLDAWKLQWREGDAESPHIFWDSDVAKWLEAAAYSLGVCPDRSLERKADALIASIEKAQQPDGYLNVHFTIVAPESRWSNLRDLHELYCAGHLMEAAVAYHAATGKEKLLQVLCRYADYIGKVFGPKRGQKRGYPGHEEIELALVKLHRATGEERYLDLARFFVDERGRSPHYFTQEARERGDDPASYWAETYEYCQAHVPVREQKEVVGHAVRAMYLYCGMADVAAETKDRSLARACKRLWRNVTQKRMYITGGIGPTAKNEGFTVDYDLPHETAYAETCAAIGLVLWAHRMLHLDPDGGYADVMERALYNGVLSGVSLDGKRFFYANPLASYPTSGRNAPDCSPHMLATRQEWFGCACCPPNIARLIASFGGYVYSQASSGAWVHHYAAGSALLQVGGQRVILEQETEYPWKGKVRICVHPEAPATFTIALRIPGWCRGAELRVNGKPIEVESITRRGYARIRREWQGGDRIELTLPMPVERMEAHPSVRQAAGRIALQRGPVVYCLEEADNGKGLNDIALPRDAKLRVRSDRRVLGGVPLIEAQARRRERSGWQGKLYSASRTKMVPAALRAIPYFMWANRRGGEMIVWIREA